MLPRQIRTLWLGAIIVVMLLALTGPVVAQSKTLFRVTTTAFVRDAPCWSATKLASILVKQVFTVTGRTFDDQWLRLSVPGVGDSAWVAASTGKVEGTLGDVPILSFDCRPAASDSTGATAATPAPDTGPKLKFTITIRSTFARDWPDATAAPSASVFQKQTYSAVGRTADGAWLAIKFPGKVNKVLVPINVGTLQGDLNTLPVLEATASLPSGTPMPVTNLPEKAMTLSPVFENLGGPSTTVTIGAKQNPVQFNVPHNIRNIYQRGLKMGNRSGVLAKVGDCESAGAGFLRAFGLGTYQPDLGEFGHLRGVIDFYRQTSPRAGAENSFTYIGASAHNGFTVWSVLDTRWADRKICNKNEMPVACEYRLIQPSLAIIMLGDADLHQMDMSTFREGLRRVIIYTLNSGTIPILSTIPGHHYKIQETEAFNWAITVLGQEYGVPVIDLKAALDHLPNKGMVSDGFHMTVPPGDELSGNFAQPNVEKYGTTIRNLVSLQALEAVWQVLNSQ